MSLFENDPLKNCTKWVRHALDRDPTVKFMLQKMEEAGCTPPKDFVTTEMCEAEVGGGFMPDKGVVICAQHLHSPEEVKNTMVHELIHAYDYCRAASMDWCNCDHHACSEIRAATLSGDCDLKQELARGNYALRGQHKICVRRRAEISVAMNPYCGGKKAKASVDRVFDTCFKDTAPFDRRP